MDFAFSEEQEMLRASARSFLADRVPPERLVELAESESGWDEESWREIAGLGWIGLSAPEHAGGSGMTFLDEAVLFEELGRALYPGPYLATVALAQPALERAPELLESVASGAETATFAWAETEASSALDALEHVKAEAGGGEGSWTVTGDKRLVPDAGAASLIVVLARSAEGPGLWAVRACDAEVRSASTMDSTRRFGEVRLDAAPATLLVAPGEAEAVLRTIRLRGLAALALEAVGVAQRALELAVAHANERKQFDRPIGSYQAVSHPIANIYVETELARSLAYWAAWCVAENDSQAPAAVAAAKASAAEAAVAACERSIQVHGGIGFTWEHVLHRYYKRAQWIEAFEGYGRAHRAEVARYLLD